MILPLLRKNSMDFSAIENRPWQLASKLVRLLAFIASSLILLAALELLDLFTERYTEWAHF